MKTTDSDMSTETLQARNGAAAILISASLQIQNFGAAT
jgi:hypothetical protein